MLITVESTYENGVVRLDEPAPPTTQTRKVLVTFLEPAVAGAAAWPPPTPVPRFHFDEALAISAVTSHISVADEVIAERQERD